MMAYPQPKDSYEPVHFNESLAHEYIFITDPKYLFWIYL